MRTKALTIDCVDCKLCNIDDDAKYICGWGTTPKIMNNAKGKKALRCKLKGR
jgi:hypothetical protein